MVYTLGGGQQHHPVGAGLELCPPNWWGLENRARCYFLARLLRRKISITDITELITTQTRGLSSVTAL